MSLHNMNRLISKNALVALALGTVGVATDSVQAQGSNREQFEAQKKGRYVYTPFTAMASPVVLPMDGKLSAADWATGLDVSLGGVLFPHIHVDTALGTSTTDQENLAAGHHDPNTNGFTWQNIEFGLSGRFNDYFEAFGTYAATVSPDGEWQAKYEEWFAKLQNLDAGWLGGFEVRGGRIYNRFGIQNTYHPHGFDWVDQYLVNARTLGEDSLTIIGADVTWKLPVPWTSQLDVAVGVAPDPHDHAHGETRFIEGAMFDAEGAVFDDVMTVANWTNIYNYNDFHQYRAGVSGAWGDNQYGRGTQVYGAHFEYQWRERGFEPGGRYLRWRTEVMWREWGAQSGVTLPGHEHDHHDHGHEHDHHDHGHEHAHHDEHEEHHDDHEEHEDHHDKHAHHDEHDEHDHHGEHDEHGHEHDDGDGAVRRANFRDFGFYTSLLYGFNDRFEAGLRAEYVTGDLLAGLDNRFRFSPGLTYYINDARTLRFRVQYNYDHSSEFGTDHSVWGQLSFTWGGPEVR